MADLFDRAGAADPGLMRRVRSVLSGVVKSISRWWRSRRATKVLLLAGIVGAAVYVVGEVLSGLLYIYDSTRPTASRISGSAS